MANLPFQILKPQEVIQQKIRDLERRLRAVENTGAPTQALVDNSGGGGPHTHSIEDIIGLVNALSDKANYIHTHNIGDVTGLQNEIDSLRDAIDNLDGGSGTITGAEAVMYTLNHTGAASYTINHNFNSIALVAQVANPITGATRNATVIRHNNDVKISFSPNPPSGTSLVMLIKAGEAAMEEAQGYAETLMALNPWSFYDLEDSAAPFADNTDSGRVMTERSGTAFTQQPAVIPSDAGSKFSAHIKGLNMPAPPSGSSSFTFGGWFRPFDEILTTRLIFIADGNSSNFQIRSDYKMTTMATGLSDASTPLTVPLRDDGAFFLVWTYDGTKVGQYGNGLMTGYLNTTNVNLSSNLQIGANDYVYYTQRVDGIFAFTRALTVEELDSLYQAGIG